MKKTEADYSHLLTLLNEPDLFDPELFSASGRDYLQSSSKLMFDAICSLSVFPVALLPTVMGAAAVKLIDRENPLFQQTRLTRNAMPFTIQKLRTMPGVREQTDSDGRFNDPRRSRVGRILSLLRIDEAPQLYNVARREMSIICPRPLMDLQFLNAKRLVGPKRADEWVKIRSLAQTGIFDEFSNMHHRREITGDPSEQLEQRIDIESAYILDKASLGEDLRILIQTVGLFGNTALNFARQSLGGQSSRELS